MYVDFFIKIHRYNISSIDYSDVSDAETEGAKPSKESHWPHNFFLTLKTFHKII